MFRDEKATDRRAKRQANRMMKRMVKRKVGALQCAGYEDDGWSSAMVVVVVVVEGEKRNEAVEMTWTSSA